jgi:hypothetical protein
LGLISDTNAMIFDHFNRLEDIEVRYHFTRMPGTPFSIPGIPLRLGSMPALRCFRGALHDVRVFATGRPVAQVTVIEPWQTGGARLPGRARRWNEQTGENSYIPLETLRSWLEGIGRLPMIRRLTLPVGSLDEVVLGKITMACPNAEWLHFALEALRDPLVGDSLYLDITQLKARRVSGGYRDMPVWPVSRWTQIAKA